MDLIRAVLLGIIQGVTEFLPISSTGHLILFSNLLNWKEDASKTFFIFIQIGSMFAILWKLRKAIFQIIKGVLSNKKKDQHFLGIIIVSLLPAIFIGGFFSDFIKLYLYKPVPVAFAFIVGGVVILLVEYRSERVSQLEFRNFFLVTSLSEISYTKAFKIGLIQTIALIPGVSRSASTITAGLLLGLNKNISVEFSFFLAIPLLAGATLLDLVKNSSIFFDQSLFLFFLVGLLTTFLFSLISIHLFLKYLVKNNFKFFAWYRIIFGLLILTVYLARSI